jgi:hypothetical protein
MVFTKWPTFTNSTLAWELVKEDYQQKGKEIPFAPVRRKLYSS